MSQFVIEGGRPLSGTLSVYGSKNSALPLLAASILTTQEITLTNIPAIIDVTNMLNILEAIGVQAVQEKPATLKLTAASINATELPASMVGALRGSILLMGALLGRARSITLPRPGGDIIGARPISVHLDAFRQLGATVEEDDSYVRIDGASMRASHVVLSEFSVTATENVLLAAATLPGRTTIEIAATEPHVVALAQLLSQMGATISGAGTHTIVVEGVSALQGATFDNIPDMLEAGTFILMAAATQSTVTVEHVPVPALLLFFKKLDAIGVDYEIADATTVHIKPASLRSFRLQTLPHPGIATDLQAPFAVVATQATGTSLIHDPMYESRFRHITELQKMGARVTICDPHRVIIEGPTTLKGRRIPSLDVRSGATLVLAGLVAAGETTIDNAEIIDRGYFDLPGRLSAIGAAITRAE